MNVTIVWLSYVVKILQNKQETDIYYLVVVDIYRICVKKTRINAAIKPRQIVGLLQLLRTRLLSRDEEAASITNL